MWVAIKSSLAFGISVILLKILTLSSQLVYHKEKTHEFQPECLKSLDYCSASSSSQRDSNISLLLYSMMNGRKHLNAYHHKRVGCNFKKIISYMWSEIWSVINRKSQKASYLEAECIKDYLLSNWEELSLWYLRGQIHRDTQLTTECNSSSHH